MSRKLLLTESELEKAECKCEAAEQLVVLGTGALVDMFDMSLTGTPGLMTAEFVTI